MNKRKPILIAILAFAAVAIFGVTALASTGNGFASVSLVRGTLAGPVHVNANHIKLQTQESVDVVAQTINIAPNGYTGWHWHPGFVLVVVESGAVRLQVGCSAHTYTVGQAFKESGMVPTQATNASSGPSVVRVTYVVPRGSALRFEANAPNCHRD